MRRGEAAGGPALREATNRGEGAGAVVPQWDRESRGERGCGGGADDIAARPHSVNGAGGRLGRCRRWPLCGRLGPSNLNLLATLSLISLSVIGDPIL
jgi:hypothetical protein